MAKVNKRTRFNVQPQKAPGMLNLLFRGVLASLIISLVSVLFLSMLSLTTDSLFLEKYMQYIMVAISMTSIFLGSAYAARKAESMVLLLGMSVGLIYVLISVSIGMKLNQESVSFLMLLNKLIAAFVAGALGGFVGANL